jgi:hypothetical protein
MCLLFRILLSVVFVHQGSRMLAVAWRISCRCMKYVGFPFLFHSNPTCAGIHFIVICFCVFCMPFSIWHAVLESVSMTALPNAFSTADEIGTSFSILYLPSKPLVSQYTPTPLSSPHYRTVVIHHQRGFLHFNLPQRFLK